MTEIHDAELIEPAPGQSADILRLLCSALDARVADQLHRARSARAHGMADVAIRAQATLEARRCSAIAAKLRGVDPVHLNIALEWLGMADPDHLPRVGPGAPAWRLPADKDGENGG